SIAKIEADGKALVAASTYHVQATRVIASLRSPSPPTSPPMLRATLPPRWLHCAPILSASRHSLSARVTRCPLDIAAPRLHRPALGGFSARRSVMAEAAPRSEQQARQDESAVTRLEDSVVTRHAATSGEQRRLEFEIRATDGEARVGCIRATRVGEAGRGGDEKAGMQSAEEGKGAQSGSEWFEVATPGLLAYTRRGLPVHLTPDVAQTLGLGSPAHQTVAAHSQARATSAAGLHGFLALPPATLLLASPRDSLLFPGGQQGGKASARPATWFDTPSGRRQVTPEDHSAIVASLLPHVAIPLHDAPPATSSLNRHRVAVQRSLTWLDEELRLAEERGGTRTALLGAVVGGPFEEERRRSARETAARTGLAGYHVAGLGLGEAVSHRDALLTAALSELPPEAMRHTSGLNIPEEVLHAVARGVDLFDCTYPHDLTLLGLASTLPLHPPWWPHTVAPGEGKGQGGTKEERDGGAVEADGVLSEVGKEKEVYGSKMNLRCSSHKRSFIPISRTCACYTCTRHTRAYLHHLLDAHEMLALVLLDIGCAAGHVSGCAAGHVSGCAAGHVSGCAAGHVSGCAAGHVSGCAAGHVSGCAAGHVSGCAADAGGSLCCTVAKRGVSREG
ncbi:unnamed protein product, partial [Closterium sp. Naga37s-1]